MKRWLLGWAGLLLSGAATCVYGDYIIIVANIGSARPKEVPNMSGSGGGFPSGPGGPGAPGAPGLGGGMGDGPGGPGFPSPGAPGGGRGAGGGQYPGGGGGMYPGGGGGRGSGGGGMYPGGGGAGSPGLPGGGPGYGGGYADNPDFLDDIEPAPQRIVAIIEVSTKDTALAQRLQLWDTKAEGIYQSPYPVQVTHHWGATYLFPSVKDDTIRLVYGAVPRSGWTSVAHMFTLKREQAHKAGGRDEEKQRRVLGLAEWALQHGLWKEFTVAMNDLTDLKKDHPAVVAYQKVQAALAKPVADNPDLNRWLGDKAFADYKPETLPDGHYVLVHNMGSEKAEANSRLRRLEDAYKTFFYWFALKSTDGNLPRTKDGKELLALPQQRLAALLIADTKDFENKQKALHPQPLVEAGFYLRQANVAVLAKEPIDPMYQALALSNRNMPGGKTTQDLLRGRKEDLKWPDQPHNETMALLITALQDQSVIATCSHEATRQLVEATGLLPRGIEAPRWLQFGMGSFFETPKGSPWLTATGPSPVYLPEYKHWADAKKKNINQVEELKKVVTDQYFRQSADGKDTDALIKARMLSWSLTYFLAHNKLPQLLQFYQELARQPRNLELDDDLLLVCFGRAFDLMDPADPTQLSETKVTRFADSWDHFIKNTSLEGEKLFQDARKLETEEPPKPAASNPSRGPGAPGSPPGGKGGGGASGGPRGS